METIGFPELLVSFLHDVDAIDTKFFEFIVFENSKFKDCIVIAVCAFEPV
jgi:hypothetical protein